MNFFTRLAALSLALAFTTSLHAQEELYGVHNNTGTQQLAHIVPDSQFIDPGPTIVGGQAYVLGSTTYDQINDRFILISAGALGAASITVVDPVSGNTLNSFPSIYNLTGLEHDDATGYVYGLLWNGNAEELVRIDVDSSSISTVSTLSGVSAFVAGSTTFDAANGRYICITDLGITVIDAATGNITSSFATQGNLSELEWDPVTNTCFGLMNSNGNAALMQVDLSAQTITNLGYAGFQAYVAGATSFNPNTREYAVVGDQMVRLIDVDNNTTITTFPTLGNMGGLEFGLNQTTVVNPPPPLCDTTKITGTVAGPANVIEAGMVYAFSWDSLLGTFTLADSASIDSGGTYCFFDPGFWGYALQAVPDPTQYPLALPTWYGNDTLVSGATIQYAGPCMGDVGPFDIVCFETDTNFFCDSTRFFGNIMLGSDLVPNAWVYLMQVDGSGNLTAIDSTQSDTAGWFGFPPVSAGIYTALAVADANVYPSAIPTYLGNLPLWTQSNALSVGDCDGPYTNWDITLLEVQASMGNNTLTGMVSMINRDNTPLEGIHVMLEESMMGLMASTHTDANGQYTFNNLEPGDYTIMVNHLNHPMASMHTVTIDENFSQSVSYDYEMENGAFNATSGSLASIGDAARAPSVVLYPNPATEQLIVSGLSATEPTNIQVLDVTGRVVLNARLTGPSAPLHLASLQPGTYLARMQSGFGVPTATLIVR